MGYQKNVLNCTCKVTPILFMVDDLWQVISQNEVEFVVIYSYNRNEVHRNYEWDYRWMDYPSEARDLKHPYDQSVSTYKGHSVLRTLIRCYFSPAHRSVVFSSSIMYSRFLSLILFYFFTVLVKSTYTQDPTTVLSTYMTW